MKTALKALSLTIALVGVTPTVAQANEDSLSTTPSCTIEFLGLRNATLGSCTPKPKPVVNHVMDVKCVGKMMKVKTTTVVADWVYNASTKMWDYAAPVVKVSHKTMPATHEACPYNIPAPAPQVDPYLMEV